MSLTSNYIGKAAAGYISAALFQGKTLDQRLINIFPEVKYKMTFQRTDFSNLLQAYSDNFTTVSGQTDSEYTVTMTELTAGHELYPKQYEQTWKANGMRSGAQNSDLPIEFEDYILNQMQLKVAEEIEYNLWRGNFTGSTTALSGYTKFTGLLKTIDNGAVLSNGAPQRVVGTTLSNSNVVAEITKVYNSVLTTIPNLIERGVKFYVSNACGGYYKQANATASPVNYYIGDRKLDFLGIEIVPVPGMPDNIMVAAHPDNLIFLTDLISDFNKILVSDMLTTTLDYKKRFRMDVTAGTGVPLTTECVLYK